MLTGYDTATSSFATPGDAEFIVCYGDLHYENEGAAHARFPELVRRGRVIDLTAAGALWKDPYSGSDIEPGNAGPGSAAGYVKGEHARGVERPVVYADLSDMHAILGLLEGAGIIVGAPGPARKWRMYTSHPTGVPHLCGPRTCGFPREADVTQFWWSSLQGAWHGFRGDLDVNLAREDAFGVPAPVDPYAIFLRQTNPSLPNHGDERLTVEQVDGALQHPRYYPYLRGKLYGELKQFRDRIWTISKYQPPDFKTPRPVADWSSNRRGTRWQLLNDRMKKIAALPR